MESDFFADQSFEGLDLGRDELKKGDYDNCVFLKCDFSNADLSGFRFLDCTFSDSNLSLVKSNETSLREISFINSKMLGWRFDQCHPFGFSVSFDGCILNQSTFHKIKLPGTLFRACKLLEVDFTEADLHQAIFDRSDLSGSVFDQTNLEKADFRTALNYIIDPERNNIKKARFGFPGVIGLLSRFDIQLDL